MLKVCAVKDSAIGAYGTPIFCVSRGQALRSFMDEVKRAESPMNAHPEDYELYDLGDFDEVNGVFLGDKIELMMKGSDVSGE